MDTVVMQKEGKPPMDLASQSQPLVVPSVQSLVAPAVLTLDRAVKERRDQDVPFMNWWLAVLVVSPFTAGIYSVVIFFKLIGRVNAFKLRRRRYYDAVVDFTAKYAEGVGKEADVQEDLRRLTISGGGALDASVPYIGAWLSFFLTIITLGIWGLVVLYRLNKAWYAFEVIERDFDDSLGQAWVKLGLTKYPFTFNLDASKKRGFGAYLLLSVVTLGIWSYVWYYKIYTDPDNIYPEFHGVEDIVLQTARAA